MISRCFFRDLTAIAHMSLDTPRQIETIAHLARLALKPRPRSRSTSTACRASSSWSGSWTRRTPAASSPWRIRSRAGAAPARRRGHRNRPRTSSTSATRRRSRPACTSCRGSSSKRCMHLQTVAAAGARRCGRASSRAIELTREACWRASSARQPALNAFITVDGRAGAGRGRGRRPAAGRRRRRAADRRADRAQGHLLHRGRAHHLRLEDARRTSSRPTTPPWSRG